MLHPIKKQILKDDSVIIPFEQKEEKRNVISYQAPEWQSKDVFLSGNNAPVFEEKYIKNLPVTGELPTWLNGVYMRNGPNPHFHSEDYTYPYDGDGMLHAIYFEKDGVKYRNRWIKTKELEAEKRAKKSLWHSLIKPKFPKLKDRKLFDVPFTPVKNTANTNIVYHGGHLMALYEGGKPYKMTEDLETIGEFDYHGKIKGMMPHPKVDPYTGELHFLQYSVVQFPYLRYYVVNRRGQVSKDVPIFIKTPTVLHDMVLTPNYVIFFLCPMELSFMNILFSKNPMKWKSNKGTKIGIIPRHGNSKNIKWIETEPFFVWHTMNGYEVGEDIIIDYVHHQQDKKGKTIDSPNLYRIQLHPDKGIKSHAPLDDEFIEFPAINNRKMGQNYKFGYVARRDENKYDDLNDTYFTELVQYNLENQTKKYHHLPKNQFVGEPTFVPHPYKTDEIDGVIIAYVYDENSDKTKLIVIEPLNFDKAPIAIIELPFRVPNGFHGDWIGF